AVEFFGGMRSSVEAQGLVLSAPHDEIFGVIPFSVSTVGKPGTPPSVLAATTVTEDSVYTVQGVSPTAHVEEDWRLRAIGRSFRRPAPVGMERAEVPAKPEVADPSAYKAGLITGYVSMGCLGLRRLTAGVKRRKPARRK